MDLIVRGGTVVTVGGRAVVDVGVRDGVVVQLGGEMSAGTGGREIDATGRVVTPGGVDAHVHLTDPIRGDPDWHWSDDFESGTRAALAGGITTVGNMSFPPRDGTIADAIEQDDADARALAVTDYFLHPVLMRATQENLDCIACCTKRARSGPHVHQVFPVLQPLRPERAGLPDRDVSRRPTAASRSSTARTPPSWTAAATCCAKPARRIRSFFPEARPVQPEVVATQRAVGFAETTGCPSYVVHLASAGALEACHDGRRRGVPIYVETRPIYLHLTRRRFEEEDGAKYAGAPPLREQSDVDALWAGLAFGNVDTLATDHAPWMLAEKLDPAFDATNLRQGVADLETCLPMLYSPAC